MSQSVTVYINDKCATPAECHSTITVTADEQYNLFDKANALLWFLAKQETPEFATYTFKGGVEWANNIRMKSLPTPKRLQPIVDMWAKELAAPKTTVTEGKTLSDFWLDIDALTNLPQAHPDVEVKITTLDGEYSIGSVEILKDSNGSSYISIQSLEGYA